MNYYSKPRISNSSLSMINPREGGSPRVFKKFLDGTYEDKDSKALREGTLIHRRLLEPETFTIYNKVRPSDLMTNVLDTVLKPLDKEFLSMHSIEYFKTDLIQTAKDFGYGNGKYKDDRIWKELNKAPVLNYFIFLQEASGKIILNDAEHKLIEDAVESVEQDSLIKEMLSNKTSLFGQDVTIFNELEILWEIDDLKLKSKLDRVVLSHTDKHITLIDLKTTREDLHYFPLTIVKRDIDRQMAFYKAALKYAYPEYNVEEVYILSYHKQINEWGVSQIAPEILQAGKLKFISLLDRIKFHTKVNNWSEPMEDIQNGTKIKKTNEIMIQSLMKEKYGM